MDNSLRAPDEFMVDGMTEKNMRARIAQLEADVKLWQDAYRRLAESMASGARGVEPPPWPFPDLIRTPELPRVFPDAVVLYMAQTFGPVNPPTFTTITVTSTPPKGDEP